MKAENKQVVRVEYVSDSLLEVDSKLFLKIEQGLDTSIELLCRKIKPTQPQP